MLLTRHAMRLRLRHAAAFDATASAPCYIKRRYDYACFRSRCRRLRRCHAAAMLCYALPPLFADYCHIIAATRATPCRCATTFDTLLQLIDAYAAAAALIRATCADAVLCLLLML